MSAYMKRIDSIKARVRCSHRPGSRKYVIDPEDGKPITFVKAGTMIVAFDSRDRVVTREGENVEPTNRFYRTAETIDPYHIVLDIP